jgi:myo-inositol 2-dehydrogenase/D-chiro-inositol 1-dehydrogenase
MEKIKLGIVGLGRLGRRHAENISRNIVGAELTAVCSAVPEELAAVMGEMRPDYGTPDYMEMFRDRKLDGIVIASNSAFHCRMIRDAANAGVKNIYCEKPLGMTPDEIDTIKECVEKNNVNILQIGYNRRFDRSIMAMKEKISEGFIGRPILIRLINRDPEWDRDALLSFSPTSGGLVFDMLTHDYDAARFLIESDAETVYGIGGAYGYEGLAEINDIDNCIISVGFENGVMGSFETSRNSTYGYHSEIEVFGTKGALRMGATPNRDRLVSMDSRGVNTECVKWFFEFWEPTFLAELQDFADCIRQGRQPKAGLSDGYKAAKWAFAAKEAVDGRTIVRMNG